MSSDWKMLLLGDVYEYCSGLSKPRSEFGSGHPFLGFKDVFYNSAVPKVLNELVRSTQQEQNRCSIKRGDLFLTRTSETMDELGMSSVALKDYPNATFNGFTKRLRPKSSDVIAPEYARYYFRSTHFRQSVNAMSTMSTRASLNNEILDRLQVVLPPLKEQKCIGYLLATLDDKIELNRKTNETLEAMAKALFKSWFVDFDPVRAKAEGRPTGLPAEISDLFPDSFEDSELGEIPCGWRDGEIQDIAELNPETWGSRNQPLRVRYLDLSNVKYGKIDSIEEYEWEDAPSRARRILKTGDTVVGTVRPGNGSYCLIGEDGITGSTGFAVLRPKNKNDSAFVYLGSCSKENIDRLAHLADGGAYPAVRPELVAQTPIIIAPRDLLDCFSRSVSPLFAAAEERKQSSKLLCQVRDALLPKLISGEIRIPDAEKLLEEVGV
jgi:type I restriction enzyme S subunit